MDLPSDAAAPPGAGPTLMATAAERKVGRWHVASRVTAAIIPGFLLTNTLGVFLALLAPGGKALGTAYATLASYALYTAIIIWIFSVKRLRTIWVGLCAGIVVTGGGAWLLLLLERGQ